MLLTLVITVAVLYTYRYACKQCSAEWLHLITQLFTNGFCGGEMTARWYKSKFSVAAK